LLGPILVVNWRRNARREKFLRQLPDAFELIARILHSGHSVPQALKAVKEGFEDPLGGEFARCQEQQNLGLLPEITFADMAQRIDITEMRIFVVALLIQRKTGGNLAEVMERLSQMIRARVRIRQQAQTLTAEGRLQATVLLVLPIVLFFTLRVLNRAYADVLLEHPNLIGGMAAAMVIGALWIRKIIRLDV
jgi:tight adherence protein B